MKQKNMPMRKLQRQMVAQGKDINSLENVKLLMEARVRRSKKRS